jgi:hypothetical protein
MKAVKHCESAKSPESRNQKAGTTIDAEPQINRSMLDNYKRKKYLTEKRWKDNSTHSHQELPVIKPVLRTDQMIPAIKCDSPKARALTMIQQQYLDNQKLPSKPKESARWDERKQPRSALEFDTDVPKNDTSRTINTFKAR